LGGGCIDYVVTNSIQMKKGWDRQRRTRVWFWL